MAVARPTPPISSAPGGCCWQLPWLAPGWSPCSWQTAHGPGFNGNTGNAMLPPARRDLQDLPDVPHGALDFSELELHGLHPGQVIDFSTNTNAFGPPPEVRAAVAAAVAGTTLSSTPTGRRWSCDAAWRRTYALAARTSWLATAQPS